MNRRASIALTVAASLATGCLRTSVNQVTLHPTPDIALETLDGTPLLARGADEAVVARGKYGTPFAGIPYEVVARRAASGAISLTCPECVDASWPYRSTSRIDLVDDVGTAHPALSWNVDARGSNLVTTYDLCMISRSRGGCAAPVRTNLVTPLDDVVEARRRDEPVRVWGWMLLAVGVAGAAMTTAAVFATSGSASAAERAPWAALAVTPSIAIGGVGLWHLVTPTREQIWRPDELDASRH